jgi:hypothetical protein
MALNVECPGCLTPYALPEEQRGQTYRCATCLNVFVVEAAAEEAPRVVQPVDAVAAEAPKMIQLIDEEPYVAMPVDPKALSRGRAAGKGPGLPRMPARKKKLGGERVALLITALIAVLTVGGAAAAIGYRVWRDPWNTKTQNPGVTPGGGAGPRNIVVQPVARRIGLDCEDREVKEVLFSDEATHQAVVVRRKGDRSLRMDRYDLAAEKRLGGFDVNADGLLTRPLSFSPRGTRFAYEDKQHVVIVSTESGQEAVRWRPYAEKQFLAAGENPSEQYLARFDFLGEDRVLTINGAGGLDLWTVPELKPVYHVPGQRERRFLDQHSGLGLSPDRKALAVFNGEGFDLRDTADGRLLQKTAHVAKFNTVRSAWGVAFSADGRSIAAVLTVGKGGFAVEQTLVRWDALTGQHLSDVPLPQLFDGAICTIAWWGSNYVLVHASMGNVGRVVSWRTGQIVRRVEAGYWLRSGRVAPASPDGRLWYTAGSDDSSTALLTTVDPPENELRAGPNRPDETWWLTSKGIIK